MITIPLSLLPEDKVAQERIWRSWLPDKVADVSREGDKWKIELSWPLISGLTNDDQIISNIPLELGRYQLSDSLAIARTHWKNMHLCMSDSWTLLEWSRFISTNRDARPVIIHFDSHSDLMSPFLTRQDQGFLDLISGDFVSVFSPKSVEKAIESGAIGIGSFVVPFLVEVPCEALVHICPPSYQPQIRGWGNLQYVEAQGDPFPLSKRPSVRRTESPEGLCRHLVAETFINCGLDLSNKNVLIHIDLDYFNNRINGDSDWHLNPNIHDPNLADMIQQVDRVILELQNCGMKQAANIVVACSPEFCPSIFWKSLIDRISEKMDFTR
jgi:hypothetical protein